MILPKGAKDTFKSNGRTFYAVNLVRHKEDAKFEKKSLHNRGYYARIKYVYPYYIIYRTEERTL